MVTENELFALLDLHQGLLCRVRTNDAPVRCGAVATYLHHRDITGPKGTRHIATPVCIEHARKFSDAARVKLPFLRGVPLMTYGSRSEPIDLYQTPNLSSESGVMTGAQVVAAMTGATKSITERIADELQLFVKQQEVLGRQIEVGIERCRTMLRMLNEANERKYR